MKTLSAHRPLNASFKQAQPLPLVDPALLPVLARNGARPAAGSSGTAGPSMPHSRPQESGLGIPLICPSPRASTQVALAVLALGTLFCLGQVVPAPLVKFACELAVTVATGRWIG